MVNKGSSILNLSAIWLAGYSGVPSEENVRRNAAECQTNIKTRTYITVALSMSHGIQIEDLLQLRSSNTGSLGNYESWEIIQNKHMNSYFGRFFDWL